MEEKALASLESEKCGMVLIPFNWDSNHWILITLNPKEHFYNILDSMTKAKKLPDKVAKWLKKKAPNTSWKLNYFFPTEHQQDSASCGGWIVWYVKQLCAGKNPAEIHKEGITLKIKKEIQ
jgi:hypothetical protein